MITEHKADWTRIPGTPSGTNIALGRRTHRQSVLELACSPVSSGDATHMDEIHRLTRVTARGLRLPRQAFNTDTDRGPKGKGRLMRVCGLRRLASPFARVSGNTPRARGFLRARWKAAPHAAHTRGQPISVVGHGEWRSARGCGGRSHGHRSTVRTQRTPNAQDERVFKNT